MSRSFRLQSILVTFFLVLRPWTTTSPSFAEAIATSVNISQAPTIATATETIELDLARFVASEQVHLNNPPFRWRAIDHMVLHDIDGAVCAYAFLFAKSDSTFQTPEDLRRHILEKSTILHHAQEEAVEANPDSRIEGVTQDLVVEAEEALYAFNDLATVITGAVSDSPLILRHFRGIPEFWVQAETLDATTSKRLYDTTLARVSSVIMITSMDFRLAVSEDSQPVKESATLRTVEKSALPATAQTINVNSKKTQTIEAVKVERQAIENRKRQRFNTLEPTERAQYEQALKDRAKSLADEWQKRREVWQKRAAEAGSISEGGAR